MLPDSRAGSQAAPGRSGSACEDATRSPVSRPPARCRALSVLTAPSTLASVAERSAREQPRKVARALTISGSAANLAFALRPAAHTRATPAAKPGVGAAWVGALLSACLLAALACERPARPPGPPRRVLLLTVDTLREDHVGGVDLYPEPAMPFVAAPFLSKAANGGVIFAINFCPKPPGAR